MSKHALSPLPYASDAPEPFYDKATVQIHHGKHHRAYVDNLDAAIRAAFDGFESFKALWRESALDLFGSGWTFLLAEETGVLVIRNFADQESSVGAGLRHVPRIDVWEHASISSSGPAA